MTTLANQYLREMGVEVWVLRQKIARARHPLPATALTVQPGQSADHLDRARPAPARAGGTQAAGEAAVPRFHLCFMTTPGVSLVFSIPHDADAVPAPRHRFAEDILLALGAGAGATLSSVRWPMVQSTHIDQSEHAARVVLRQRLEHCAPFLLVFGAEAARWVGETSTKRGLELDDIEDYIETPISKRELWQSLMPVRSEVTS